ncbi:MAG: hypothetical protein P1P93_04605 [Gammaproteobacteria bacterium]|nr:hypothetical protein [Gammaproteobacteria bacterium]
MINLLDKNIKWYKDHGGLEKIETMMEDYWNNSRRMESETVVDLEKHLWVVNSTAATLILGFLQTQETVYKMQVLSACSFVVGVLFLFFLKFVSSITSSRDRSRFQEAASKFQAGEDTDYIFKTVRDTKFKFLKWLYLFFQYGSGVLFMLGLIFLLVQIWPNP